MQARKFFDVKDLEDFWICLNWKSKILLQIVSDFLRKCPLNTWFFSLSETNVQRFGAKKKSEIIVKFEFDSREYSCWDALKSFVPTVEF